MPPHVCAGQRRPQEHAGHGHIQAGHSEQHGAAGACRQLISLRPCFMLPIVHADPPCARTLQVVYSTDCTFTVLSHAQNYTRFLLKLVGGWCT